MRDFKRLVEVLATKEILLNEIIEFLKSKNLWDEFLSISSVKILPSNTLTQPENKL